MNDSSSEDERIERILRNERGEDYVDEGIVTSVGYFDTEDIIIDRTYPLPSRPRYQVLYSSDEEDEEEAARGGRQLYDMYPHHVKNVSRGDDDTCGSTLRNIFMNTRMNGEGIPNVEISRPERIIGMGVRGGQNIFYFVVWEETGRDSYPVNENVMRWKFPELVIEFHEDMVLNPTRYVEL
ncbi:uncharacterized protein LOC111036404 [Myzus persicae]|uniref:uncharacterized protein LOC111036404 n=1 Tax=Myzus persicae TaxID=13164 RepID=UPI000B9316C4|nr:uncharacterized protein LOC111036404 [Myzus persicae]